MNRKAVLALVLVVLSLYAVDTAWACSCAPQPPPQEALKQSVAVFTGTVAGVTTSGQNRLVQIRVEKVWKGAKCGEVTVTTALDDAACGYNFEVGQSYLVYATKEKGKLSVSLCSRTSLTSQAGEDLTALGEPATTCPAQ
jgi:shikimate kinase